MPKKLKNRNSAKQRLLQTPSVQTRPVQFANSSMLVGPLEDVTAILEFLENFQDSVNPQNKLPSRLISMKMPEPLLSAFRFKAERAGVPYQTMIKKLMVDWLAEHDLNIGQSPF